MSPETHTIAVSLAERSYEVRIGSNLLAQAGAHVAALKPVRKLFVVTDQTVNTLHGAVLRESLTKAGLASSWLTLPPGEPTKDFAHLEQVCSFLLDGHIERSDLVVAFGGGVIGDLAGFAAGIIKRGVGFVQIPTTLLAQVDSSVGGKTAINTPQGKNLVGLFHQPSLVLADTAVLNALPPRDIRAGFAEVAKYGLLGDADFFGWLESNAQAVLSDDGPARTHAISKSVAAKAHIVGLDERETGPRALLNLGHTFGHALEAETGMSDRLLHGEAVSIGMVLAFALSSKMGLCPPEAPDRVRAFLRAHGLPVSPRDIPGFDAPPERLLDHMAHDKKAQGGKLTLILARKIGEAFVAHDVPAAPILSVLHDETAP
ncbi:MAG TPA: 3-dehydroquinate synthase [Alphaproteobacteria bacterium]|nr:3-dehydroquinate synthase [Alphaproteobacteria bacterium]HAJ46906.1 3-dehydroquinate synthase [Alphaproteobacteria bacterium]